MLGRRAGTRFACFSIPSATTLLVLSLVIYTYRTFILQYFPPLAVKSSVVQHPIEVEGEQAAIDVNGDGVPDWCYQENEAETTYCLLSDGIWTTLATDPFTGDAIATAALDESPQIPTVSPATAPETEETVSPEVTALPPAAEEPSWSIAAVPTTLATSTTAAQSFPTAILPSTRRFEADNGTKWKIEYVGDIRFTGDLADKNLVGDKCRSSVLGSKVIWNCGDMWCDFNYTICGFAMGPAMYGTDDVMVINTTGIEHIYNNDFLTPWENDTKPQLPYEFWGMDTSNVAAINDSHGVAYGFEVWRHAPDKDLRRGNAVAWVTLGDEKPIATRVGPLLTGPDAVELGMLAIAHYDNYIYTYSQGGPSRVIVTRVLAAADIFDAANYESLRYGTDDVWEPVIPEASTSSYGMTTANKNHKFGCQVYGSAFYNNYLNKYVIICNIYMVATNMYTSDTPYGPWSGEYGLLRGWHGYGSMAHPQYSPNGSHKEFYFSLGPNDRFNMFKVTFGYDEQGMLG